MSALYTLSEDKLKEHINAAKEIVGDEKAEEIEKRADERFRTKASKEYYNVDPEDIDFKDIPGKGNLVITDPFGRMFRVPEEATIQKALFQVAQLVPKQGEVTYNQFLGFMDIYSFFPALDEFVFRDDVNFDGWLDDDGRYPSDSYKLLRFKGLVRPRKSEYDDQSGDGIWNNRRYW